MNNSNSGLVKELHEHELGQEPEEINLSLYSEIGTDSILGL